MPDAAAKLRKAKYRDEFYTEYAARLGVSVDVLKRAVEPDSF